MDSTSRSQEYLLVEEIVTLLRGRQEAADSLEQDAARAFRVHRTAARCLEVLSRTTAVPTGELARRVGLTSGAMTTLLDGLEDAGAIRRFRIAGGDRRQVHVELTSEGRDVADRVWGELYMPLRALAERHDSSTLASIRDFLRDANDILARRSTAGHDVDHAVPAPTEALMEVVRDRVAERLPRDRARRPMGAS